MDIFLDPESGKPLAGQLYEQLRRAITTGRLLPGDQLVPSRQLAGELGVSRHTVTTAYGRLVAEGHAGGTRRRRQRGGIRVAGTAQGGEPGGRPSPGPAVRRLVAVFPAAPARLPFRSPAGPYGPRAIPRCDVVPPGRRRSRRRTSGVRRPSREDQAAAGHRRLGGPVAIGGGREKTQSWSPAAPSMPSTWSPGSCLSPATVSRSRIPGTCQWCACSALSARGSLAYPSMTRAWSWIYCRPRRASCTSRPRINIPSA